MEERDKASDETGRLPLPALSAADEESTVNAQAVQHALVEATTALCDSVNCGDRRREHERANPPPRLSVRQQEKRCPVLERSPLAVANLTLLNVLNVADQFDAVVTLQVQQQKKKLAKTRKADPLGKGRTTILNTSEGHGKPGEHDISPM